MRLGHAQSQPFAIAAGIYAALPDTLLEFMREQRCGGNPFLDQKCHQLDGRTIDGPMPDGTSLDCTGGWHDAADLLKYLLTSGNATAFFAASQVPPFDAAGVHGQSARRKPLCDLDLRLPTHSGRHWPQVRAQCPAALSNPYEMNMVCRSWRRNCALQADLEMLEIRWPPCSGDGSGRSHEGSVSHGLAGLAAMACWRFAPAMHKRAVVNQEPRP